MALMRSEVRRLRVLDLEIVRHHEDGQEWVPHWHDEWSFGAIIRGECRCSVAGRPFTAREGDLIAIAPGVIHTGALVAAGPTQGVTVMMVYVPPSWFIKTGFKNTLRSAKVQSPKLVKQAGKLATPESVVSWLEQAVQILGKASNQMVDLTNPPLPGPSVLTLFERTKTAIFKGEQTVQGLAQHCGVSRERLHRVFKHWLGMSPAEYLRAVRIHRARTMLLEGVDVSSVAADCGFADQAHFIRWFKRVFGYTPGDLISCSGIRR